MKSLKIILSKKQYFAVSWVFASLNFMIGTWVLYIPYIKEKLQLNDSEIGQALFCFALGILLFLPLVPLISNKIGIGRFTIIGILLISIAFLAPLVVSNYLFLCLSLFVSGIFVGATDVVMNALVSKIEKDNSQNFMSAAHGFFSLGGAIAAFFGSFLISSVSHPFYHMLIMTTFVMITNLLLAKNYFRITEETTQKTKNKYQFKALKPLFLIAFIAFVILSSEGAIEHWSSLYFKDVIKITQENLLGSGFLIFSIMMMIGRFFADGISEKIGSIKIVFYGCLLASIGYGCILVSIFEVTVIGFGVVGLGLSVIIPELFRLAGTTKNVKPSLGISFVSGIGFSGFLIGPVLLGYISNEYSLQGSFFVLKLLTILVLFSILFKFRKLFKNNR